MPYGDQPGSDVSCGAAGHEPRADDSTTWHTQRKEEGVCSSVSEPTLGASAVCDETEKDKKKKVAKFMDL